ncbi:response regulator transcription factor [Jatrophihabitans sp. YIM 134969]
MRPTLAFDGAWLAAVDPGGPDYRTVESVDLSEGIVDFLAGPTMARDIEITGTDVARPPLSPSDLPYPAEELSTWADCLMPASVYEALAVGLFAADGRHVGFLALLSGDRRPPTAAARHALQQLVPVFARSIDPMRSVTAASRLVRGATAGIVLRDDGSCEPLPGLPTHLLMTPDSVLVRVCRDRLGARQPFSSFLWPVAGHRHGESHVQVTVLAVPDDVTSRTTAVAVMSPQPDLRGLTPRELEVLGLLVEGCTNQEIARTLTVAPRTVAAHIEHVLVKLDATSRTLAAVRAERDGLYVPSAGATSPAPSGAVVDRTSVAVGQPAPARRQKSAPVPRSTADACCVVDEHGEVLAVNDAWIGFAGVPTSARNGVGANYLEVCRASESAGAPAVGAALRALNAVLSGRRTSSWTVYPCAVPGGLRWFRVGFTARGHSGHVLVRHVDVTAQMTPGSGSAFDELVADAAGTLTETGLLLAVDEWLTGPTRPAVVVMVTDRVPLPPQATQLAEFVGRVSGDLLATVVTADETDAALRTADALIAASHPARADSTQWGLAVRTATDAGVTLVARAHQNRLRKSRIDVTGGPDAESTRR